MIIIIIIFIVMVTLITVLWIYKKDTKIINDNADEDQRVLQEHLGLPGQRRAQCQGRVAIAAVTGRAQGQARRRGRAAGCRCRRGLRLGGGHAQHHEKGRRLAGDGLYLGHGHAQRAYDTR